ncbi:16S rRNA (uracil(1498)-N(3))-methyltransferase [Propionibacteriaceae bacterium G57]|uniref:16S rRNA (uracil(1498)-N(3))-methyltransferase n=1 Tax=Aestuariimicrobium sp. G57 TaxID=3418485 RepID=UPI003DA6E9F3
MSDALYLGDPARLAVAAVGQPLTLDGDEGRHAATVKRTRAGETILVSDGLGRAARLRVTEVAGNTVTGEVIEVVVADAPRHTWRVVQALAKGDRSDLSVELLTEVGVHHLTAWQSQRTIVKWDNKADRGLAKWRSTAREAAKQSRRSWVPQVHDQVVTTKSLVAHLAAVGGAGEGGLVLVAHEEATTPISEVVLPPSGPVTVLVGPEGGISPDELAMLVEAGAQPVLVSDGVLRASTAGAVALVQLQLLADLQAAGE